MNVKKLENTLTLKIIKRKSIDDAYPVVWPNLIVGRGYRVVQGSHNSMLEKGDYVRREKDGRVYCREAYGYIEPIYVKSAFFGATLVPDCSIWERIRRWVWG